MAFGDGIDILEGEYAIVFKDLEAGDLSFDNLTENAVVHGIPPLRGLKEAGLSFVSASKKFNSLLLPQHGLREKHIMAKQYHYYKG